jgi:hypothetical protein
MKGPTKTPFKARNNIKTMILASTRIKPNRSSLTKTNLKAAAASKTKVTEMTNYQTVILKKLSKILAKHQ